MINSFNICFVSLFTEERLDNSLEINGSGMHIIKRFSEYEIDINEIKSLKDLNDLSKAAGSDCINMVIL